MARRRKVFISLTPGQDGYIQQIMARNFRTTYTEAIGDLIAMCRKYEEANTPPPPPSVTRNTDPQEQDEPRNIPHPDQLNDENKGTFLTQTEYDILMSLKGRGPRS